MNQPKYQVEEVLMSMRAFPTESSGRQGSKKMKSSRLLLKAKKGMRLNSFMRELGGELAHAADSFFANNRPAWIPEHFRHSGDLLVAYGLRPYNEAQDHEGVTVARALMAYDSRRCRG